MVITFKGQKETIENVAKQIAEVEGSGTGFWLARVTPTSVQSDSFGLAVDAEEGEVVSVCWEIMGGLEEATVWLD